MKKTGKLIASATVLLASIAAQSGAQAACWLDNFGYLWNLNVVNDTATAQISAGTVTIGGVQYGAGSTWRKGTNSVTVGSNYGTSFHYNLAWRFGSATGVWVNTDGAGGNGEVTSFTSSACDAVPAAAADVSGAAPGN